VLDVRDRRIRFRIHSSDGTPMATGYWPYTRMGEPRSADGYSMAGIDLMFQWFFKRR
jgi:hypothetical protein